MTKNSNKDRARPGFHLYFRSVSYVTATGIPGRHNTPERCECQSNGNHATPPKY
jgi:hypothetical protein